MDRPHRRELMNISKRSGWVKFAPGTVVTWGTGFSRARVVDVRLSNTAGTDEFKVEFLTSVDSDEGGQNWRPGTTAWFKAHDLRSVN